MWLIRLIIFYIIGNNVFFIDGPGGTGKTFVYRMLLATLRANKKFSIGCCIFMDCCSITAILSYNLKTLFYFKILS